MENIIIFIIFLITSYIIFINQTKNKENFKKSDPKIPEKCFYDDELVGIHNMFVLAMKNDIDLLPKVKGKLLAAVCILDLVANKKPGWDKYLDSESKKRGSNKKEALTQVCNEFMAVAKIFFLKNNLIYLLAPIPITAGKEVTYLPSNFEAYEKLINKKINDIDV